MGHRKGGRPDRAARFPQCREFTGRPTEACLPGAAGGAITFQCPAEFPFRSLSTPVWPTTERGYGLTAQSGRSGKQANVGKKRTWETIEYIRGAIARPECHVRHVRHHHMRHVVSVACGR